jgi:hypothetical protein
MRITKSALALLAAVSLPLAVLEPATAQVGAEFAGDEGGKPVAAMASSSSVALRSRPLGLQSARSLNGAPGRELGPAGLPSRLASRPAQAAHLRFRMAGAARQTSMQKLVGGSSRTAFVAK